MKKFHEPVLVSEVIEALQIGKDAHSNNLVIDATVGLGGHAREIIKNGGRVLGIDADKQSLKVAEKVLKQVCPALDSDSRAGFKLVHGNFKDIDRIAPNNGFEKVQGVLFDLGISSSQLSLVKRGFSFQDERNPLDMRLDRDNQKVTAADLLNALDKTKLEKVFQVTLSYGQSKSLAKKIIEQKKREKFKTIGDFLKTVGKHRTKAKLHPATLPFLALRIAVNSELESLDLALPKAFDLLVGRGRLVVISFHSGEDVIVKRFFKQKVLSGEAKLANKKPIVPSKKEIDANPRARSAKMRVLERCL